MISFLAAAILGSTFLLNPPATSIWAFAELNPTGGIEARAKVCGVSDVAVLSSTVFQITTESMAKGDLEKHRDVVQRIEKQYVAGSRSERAALVLELRKYGTRRLVDQTWIKMDSLLVHYLTVVDLASGSSMMKLEDETTGQYIAFLNEPKNSSDIQGLMQSLLDPNTPDDEHQRILKEMDKDGKERTLKLDVNGVVLYLDRGAPDAMDQMEDGFSLVWHHLPEGAGKRRIEMAMAVILKAVDDETTFSGVRLKTPVDPDNVSIDPCLVSGSEFFNGQQGGNMISLEGPTEEILKDFFGKAEMPLPNPEWTFEKLRKRVL